MWGKGDVCIRRHGEKETWEEGDVRRRRGKEM